MTFEALKTWIGIAASLGVFAAVGVILRWYWNRTRWRRFEVLIRSWARDETFGLELSAEEWQSLVAIKMCEAEFSPTEVQQFLDFAVIVAKGRASLEYQGQIKFANERENEHGGSTDHRTKGSGSE
jgi:hypothetical protein